MSLEFINVKHTGQFLPTPDRALSMLKYILPIIATGLLAGCAMHESVIPKEYTGPTALISEHGFTEEPAKAQIFYIESIDDKKIRSSYDLTQLSTISSGLSFSGFSPSGFSLSLQFVSHQVPAQPMKLKIIGRHISATPIHELASKSMGTFFYVENEIIFTPEKNKHYFVTGKLLKEGSDVWIADALTEQRVSEPWSMK
ncbi:hypothetical protein ACFQPC_07470 [Herminiimonas glaciei]|uniref:Lipoprotein n=1 Tax=Herminiimonas glaciei TaxID=523788 RepID=A0ABW2IA28_9BURK